MALWNLWWRKVVTGLVAILVVGFQMLGSVSTPVDLHESGIHFAWTGHGFQATWVETHPFTRLEEEIHEDSLRNERNRGRKKRGNAVS